jgi:hypothetical protein
MKNLKKGYIIHKITDNNYALCKILNEYNSKEETEQDLLKLLTHKKDEEGLLKDYSKKQTY